MSWSRMDVGMRGGFWAQIFAFCDHLSRSMLESLTSFGTFNSIPTDALAQIVQELNRRIVVHVVICSPIDLVAAPSTYILLLPFEPIDYRALQPV